MLKTVVYPGGHHGKVIAIMRANFITALREDPPKLWL